LKINIFKPDSVHLDSFTSDKYLKQRFPSKAKINYANAGKTAIYFILKSFNLNNANILIPYYLCSSVESAIKKSGNNVLYADIDLNDLNISLGSIKKMSEKYTIGAVLVPSLYGNPANLEEIVIFCKQQNILMIDDAAQAFGTKINDNFVGSFGNAGFMACSPGKPLAGYLGSCLWSENDCKLNTKYSLVKHLFHKIIYWEFFYNRLNVDHKNKIFSFILSISKIIFQKIFVKNIYYSFITKRDKNYLHHLIEMQNNGEFDYKNKFVEKFQNTKEYRILKPIRGIGISFKLVIIFYNNIDAQNFKQYLKDKNIYYSNGYKPLNDFVSYQKIENKLFELPIDTLSKKREYLYDAIQNFR
jgi:hypothetical protein